jgi:hypothetical protein
MFSFSNIFSNDDIEYLSTLPQVVAAKENLNKSGVVYFTIPVTETIRTSLVNKVGMDLSKLSKINELPMRWIKGDTSPHLDVGNSPFEKTYLAYINDSEGEFIIGDISYPIKANTAFVFNEGISHRTLNTGLEPRLLLGPMNEFVQPVGGTAIYYYNNYADAITENYATTIASSDYNSYNLVLGGTIYNGSIGSYTSWRIAASPGIIPVPTGIYNNGFDLATLGITSYFVYPAMPCFLEGTTVLSLIEGKETFVRIETLRSGDLIKTSRDGYKKVELIGHRDIHNPGNDDRIENRLYKCSPNRYPELNEDLFITGCHSILVDDITDDQRDKITAHMGKIYVTDKKYRLNACLDERAEPWNSEGSYQIWHLALENKDEKMNYGIYVNGGLLVETCSIRMLKSYSNLNIV